MQLGSFLISKNRNIVLAIAFMAINTITIFLTLNQEYFYTIDKEALNLFLLLLATGICFIPFFIGLKYIKSLTISKLFLIFIFTRIILFGFFTIMFYQVEMDTQTWWANIAKNILDGKLSDPYHDLTYTGLALDRWRLQPPLTMWWYTLNYIIYGLNAFFWRLVNFALELGTLFLMYLVMKELKVDRKYFKLGLLFYTFSIFPIYGITIYANFVAFPLFLGILGILFALKSRTDENYIYLAVLCFTLNALSSYYGAVWILGILILVLFKKDFNLLVVLIIEVLAIFCLVCYPFLQHDALGFLLRLTYILQLSPADEVYTTMWLIDINFVKLLPAIFAISLITVYIYKNRDKEISLEFFIIILSVFLIFTPAMAPYYLLWVLTLISIAVYSFRDYLTTYVLFLMYMYGFYLLIAIAVQLNPPSGTGLIGLLNYMDEIGFTRIIHLVIQPFFQLGLIYVIYSYTKQKFWVYALIAPFIVYYACFLLFGI